MTTEKSAIRRLTLALFVSATFSEAAYIALAFNLYRRTGSGLWVAAVFLLTLGIPGFFSPIGGAIADRFDRRVVMVTADALAAAAFVVLVFTQRPVVMLAVAFVAALVERPFGPALRAAVPNLTSPDQLARTNSTLSMGYKIGVVAGATLGGLLFDRYGPGVVFGLNAASFLISSGAIASIRASFSAPRTSDEDEGEEEYRGALAGFRHVRRRVVLLSLLVAWGFIWLAVDIVVVAEPALVQELSGGAFGYGLLGAAWGAGSVLGALLGRRVPAGTEPMAVVVETVGTAIGLAAVSLAPTMSLAVVGMAFVAVFDALGEVAGNTLIQRDTPDRVRGRVFAAFSTAGQTGNTLGFLAGGPLLDAFGPRVIYRVGAVTSALATPILIPALRGSRGERGSKTLGSTGL